MIILLIFHENFGNILKIFMYAVPYGVSWSWVHSTLFCWIIINYLGKLSLGTLSHQFLSVITNKKCTPTLENSVVTLIILNFTRFEHLSLHGVSDMQKKMKRGRKGKKSSSPNSTAIAASEVSHDMFSDFQNGLLVTSSPGASRVNDSEFSWINEISAIPVACRYQYYAISQSRWTIKEFYSLFLSPSRVE